jgi:hypothetical protein
MQQFRSSPVSRNFAGISRRHLIHHGSATHLQVSVARKDVLVMWRVGGPAACILDQGFPARLAFFSAPS